MTYSSLLEAYGWERFAADAQTAGATSLIIADLPAEEKPELRRVQLVAPTSTDERHPTGRRANGRLALPRHGDGNNRRPRGPLGGARTPRRACAERRRPACRSTPASASRRPSDARAAAELTDGVVVGSRALEAAEGGPKALHDYVRSLRDALDSA